MTINWDAAFIPTMPLLLDDRNRTNRIFTNELNGAVNILIGAQREYSQARR
jgi:hypothetical protein